MTVYRGTREAALIRLRQNQDFTIVQDDDLACVAFYSGPQDQLFAIAWKGSANNPSFHYRFNSALARQNYVDNFLANLREHRERIEQRRNTQKSIRAADYFSVGDVVVNSWGYDQTNIDFYQVVEVKEKSVVLRAIAQKGVPGSDGFMCERVVPIPDEFTDEKAFTKMVKLLTHNAWKDPYIPFKFGIGSKWDGTSCNSSWYA